MKKTKKTGGQHPIIQAFIVAIVGGLIAGIGSGIVISCLESIQRNFQKESEILFADEQNFGGACMFIRDIQKENEYITHFKYIIDPYITNADFIKKKTRQTQEAIQKNMALMNASNILLDRFFIINVEGLNFENFTPKAKILFMRINREAREKLKNYAEQIEDNIHIYNAELANLDCKQIITEQKEAEQ